MPPAAGANELLGESAGAPSIGEDGVLSIGEEGVLSMPLLGLSLKEDDDSNDAAGVSPDDGRSLGAVTMGSGLTVSIAGAAALFGFVVDAASPEDEATRFPEQPTASVNILTHKIPIATLYEQDPFSILHL